MSDSLTSDGYTQPQSYGDIPVLPTRKGKGLVSRICRKLVAEEMEQRLKTKVSTSPYFFEAPSKEANVFDIIETEFKPFYKTIPGLLLTSNANSLIKRF
jgi:hypothetical protein